MEVSTIRVCGDETVKYFSEIFEDKTKYGTKLKTGEYQEQGKYLIVDQGQELIAGYTDREGEAFFDLPAIIFGDHTRILKYVDQPFYIGADGVKILRSKLKDANYKYLFYALKYVSIPNTGYNRHFKWLRQSSIKYPDNVTQNRIVKILDTVSGIIQLRKKELNQLDYLIQARFVEMFGEPGADDFGWGLVSLGSVCCINPKKSQDKNLDIGEEVSFVPMTAVTEHGEISTTTTMKYDDVKTGFTYFAENDVLFAKITPCMENGKGAVARGLHNRIGFGSTEFHVLRPISGKTNSYWIYMLTAFPEFRKDAASNMTGSAGQRRVPVSFLENYQVAVPPIELQEQFAAFVEQTDKSKSAIKKSLEKTQLLFDSLMQKYFG